MASRSYKNKKHSFFSILMVVLLALVFIKNQILSYLKSEETFLFRLEYFKAGKNMFLENPIFGVGISGFRDNYRLYREKTSLQYSNYLDEVDSSHNLFIDLFASGGLILGASFCFFVFLILYRLCSHILNCRITNDQIALVGVWFVFIIQSLISPPNISLLIWGFILSGLIVNFTRSNTDSDIIKSIHSKISLKLITISVFLTIFITLPLNLNNYNFRSSLESGYIDNIKKNIGTWPRSEKNILLAAQLLKQNGFLNESLDFAILATTVNSNYFESWLFLAQFDQPINHKKADALRNLGRLDPLYSSYAENVPALP
jgi:O-antigen ligase